MRIVLMGTGPFAVPAFDAIASSEHEVVTVISKPNTGKEKKLIVSPVAQWAIGRNLPLWQPESVRDSDTIQQLRQLNCDLAVVCDYGQILTAETLDAFRLGTINLHGSVLPRHRGAAPIQWALIKGDPTTGVSVIRMTTGLDSGPVITTTEITIGEHENAEALEGRLSALGVASTLQAIDLIHDCEDRAEFMALGTIQDRSLATKSPRLNKSDGQIDFRLSAKKIDRLVRAMQPWPGAFAELEIGSEKALRTIIHEAFPVEEISDSACAELSPGKLLSGPALKAICDPTIDLAIATGKGLLAVVQLQPAGKRKMSAKDFAAGYCRSPNVRFQIPDVESDISSQLGD